MPLVMMRSASESVELDGAHHGLVVDLAERQRGQVLSG
jgi:hypothetical protein